MLSGGDVGDGKMLGLLEIQSGICCLCNMNKDSTGKIQS